MTFYNIFSLKKSVEKEHINGKIVVDYREKNSLVVSELIHLGFEVEYKNLEVGDYIVKETVIERKTVSDFIGSMINKRLIFQLNNMKDIKSKLLIVEGLDESELYHEESGMNENAIRGFLLSILLNYKVPIIFSKDYIDTAKFMYVLSRKQKKDISLHPSRKAKSIEEQMQFILEGFPGIGPKTARKLLIEFKTLENIFSTPIEEIKKVIGKKGEIFNLLKKPYQEHQKY